MSLPAGAQAPPGGPPPGLMQLIAQSQGGQQGPDDDQYPNDGGLSCLQDLITDAAKCIHELTDPQDVAMVTQALHLLTKVQSRLMSQGQGAGNGAASQGQ